MSEEEAMTRDDIIRMAQEASGHDFMGVRTIEFAERFAVLVAAQEREACAKLADEFYRDGMDYDIGAAIRARK